MPQGRANSGHGAASSSADPVRSSDEGVTLFPDDGESLGELLNNADYAMYKAKERGVSKLVLFHREMKAGILKRAKMEELLREALAKNQLSLHYQPQIEGATGSIRGFEALLRWSTPELGSVFAGGFHSDSRRNRPH